MPQDDTLKRLAEFKAELDRRRQTKSRLEGSYDNLMKRLKDEFGVDSIEAAEAEIERCRKEAEKAEHEREECAVELETMIRENP